MSEDQQRVCLLLIVRTQNSSVVRPSFQLTRERSLNLGQEFAKSKRKMVRLSRHSFSLLAVEALKYSAEIGTSSSQSEAGGFRFQYVCAVIKSVLTSYGSDWRACAGGGGGGVW